MTALAKYAQAYLSVWHVVCARSFFSMIFLLPFVLRQRPFFGKRKGFLTLRGLLGVSATTAFFYTIGKLPLVDASLLAQTTPLFVLALSRTFLNERACKYDWLYMIVGFIGVALVVKPSFSVLSCASVIGLLGALSAGGAQTTLRFLGGKERTTVISFYYVLVCFIVSLPPSIVKLHAIDGKVFAALLLLALVGTVAQIMITTAYRLEKAGNIAIMAYLGVPMAACWGFFLWKEIPDQWTLIGAAVTLAALAPMELSRIKLTTHQDKPA
jgi:drug/metabolite transporter (DMT)-like permease